MFTMRKATSIAHMALGTTGRDCIMRQRTKLFPVLQHRGGLRPVLQRGYCAIIAGFLLHLFDENDFY